jgi:cellobiose phosphorylase
MELSALAANHPLYQYLPDHISFTSRQVAQWRMIYFPLCATSSDQLKSSITPFLSGDIKLDKKTFLTKPASTEDLRHNVRNVFIDVHGKKILSLTDQGSSVISCVEAGHLWHKLVKKFSKEGLEVEVLNFIPVSGDNVELMRVTIRNISKKKIKITPTTVIPIFGRSLVNKHDHEHVTSLLHRTKQLAEGVFVEPAMCFNEEGHTLNKHAYFVFGSAGQGEKIAGSFPTMTSFYGDGGTAEHPQAVFERHDPMKLSLEKINGKEAVGALRFKTTDLAPKKELQLIVMIGIHDDEKKAKSVFQKFSSTDKVAKAFESNKNFWREKLNAVEFKTGNADFNAWMKWVSLQPILRRIFGCSFLPDHDYGKGGKGWRDIWQDLLSLILIEPENVRENLINNFGGVRIDGSNATIIGTKPGEFIADRNAITRVWMDHGVWPLTTLHLYIHQTQDYEILKLNVPYFRDPQFSRSLERDSAWSPAYGEKLKDQHGVIYQGSIIEHMLIQHLVQFFNVGEHNIIRLESADWNDGLDMGFKRGESVAFASFYAGNLLTLADLLKSFSQHTGLQEIKLAKEVMILLDGLSTSISYESVEEKKKLLFEEYFKAVQPVVSGEQVMVKISDIVGDLQRKGQWMFEHIRRQEKIEARLGNKKYRWYNGYYDNQARRVEGEKNKRIWMTLTGQVFAVMSGMAKDDELSEIVESVNTFLKDKKLGGYRLNTDFGLKHYLDMGRAFGFAYGTKENGAFFSHMIVMYAYALYKRGLAKEGFRVLQSIYQMSMDTDKSKIYPGIPEYFDSEGRGMYHYLTGSASWLVLTKLTQVFGVRGWEGNLLISPKLVKEEFNAKGEASVECVVAGKKIRVIFENKKRLDFGQYIIKEVCMGNRKILFSEFHSLDQRSFDQGVLLKRDVVLSWPPFVELKVVVG